ncbi:MAG: hypothetical protein NTW08_03730 [Gammaproteobacteria bacterium]|nr:hypothetical protein [Gammaproteobacteria bacterium]
MARTGFLVKNILIIGDVDGQNGEHHESIDQWDIIYNPNRPDHRRVERIVRQIQSIATYAKNHARPEQLTRAVTDEFSFYTRYSPLSINEYKAIINQTAERLKDFPPNIVIIASSMPVLWPDGTMRNAVLHIQTPNEPQSEVIIHHFSKEHHAPNDPSYSIGEMDGPGYKLQPDDHHHPLYAPNVVLSGTKLRINDPNQHKSAMVVQGYGLPPIIDTIDICFDHSHGVAMKNATTLLRALPNPPLYISHIITSNRIKKYLPHTVASVVHADYYSKNVPAVSEEKKDLIYTAFGTQSRAFIYQAKRVELLHSKLFDIATRDLSRQAITKMIDPHQNTLLHQVLLKDKKMNASCIHFGKRITKLLPFFKGAEINQQNLDGDTPLHLALHTITDANTLIRFLEQGARLDIKNHAGLSPIGLAYQLTDPAVITHLITKLINNGAVYLAHRSTILSLLDELQEPLQQKVIRSAIQFECSHSTPDIPTLIALLKQQIPNNVLHLSLSSFATRHSETVLEQVLTTDQAFADLKPNEKQIIMAYLSNSPHQIAPFKSKLNRSRQLTKQLAALFTPAESRQFQAWVEHSLSQLRVQEQNPSSTSRSTPRDVDGAQGDDPQLILIHECEKGATANIPLIINLLSQNINLQKTTNHPLTLAEQLLANVYIWSNERLISEEDIHLILNHLIPQLDSPIKNSIQKITESFETSTQDKAHVYRANIQEELYQLLLEHLLQYPIYRPISVDIIASAIDEIVDLTSGDTALYGLTLSEQIIATLYLLDQQHLLVPIQKEFILGQLFTQLDHPIEKRIEHIALSFTRPPNSRTGASSQDVEQWIYQALLMDELTKYTLSPTKQGIKSLPLAMQNTQAQQTTLNAAEQTIAHATILGDEALFYQGYVALKKNHQSLDVQKIATRLQESHQEDLSIWINDTLINIALREDLLQECLKGEQADLDCLDIIAHQIDLREACGFDNRLTFAEQLMAQAFILSTKSDNTAIADLLETAARRLPYPIETCVQHIVDSFSMPPNARYTATPSAIANFIYYTLLKKEIEIFEMTPNIDVQRILTILSQDLDLHIAPIVEHELTLAEQALRLSLLLVDVTLLEQVMIKYYQAAKQIDIKRILAACPPGPDLTLWFQAASKRIMTQWMIKKEFQAGSNADGSVILAHIHDVDVHAACGLNNGLTILEQAIATAYDLNSAELLLNVMPCNAWACIECIVTKVAKTIADPAFDLDENQKREALFKQFVYASMLSTVLHTSPPLNTDLIIDFLFHTDLRLDTAAPGERIPLIQNILHVAALNQDLKILDTIYNQLSNQLHQEDIKQAMQLITVPEHHQWLLENLTLLAKRADPIDTATLTTLSLFDRGVSSAPQQFFKEADDQRPRGKLSHPSRDR